MNTLREELETYGNLRFFSEGEGQFVASDDPHSCSFAIAQRMDGDVLVICRANGRELFNRRNTVSKISGLVDVDMLVETQGYLQWINADFDLDEEQVVFLTRSVRIRAKAAKEPTKWRYGLTNFLPEQTAIEFSTDGLRLVPVVAYPVIAKRVRRQKVAEVTYYLEISGENAPDQLANDVCSVLSIARGAAVSWIERRFFDRSGQLGEVIYASRVTRPWSAMAIAELTDGRCLLRWLEYYQEQADKWGLRHGLVKTYLDAKLDGQYLEGRSVALSVCLEMVRESASRAVGPTILTQEDFAPIESRLQSMVRSLLQGLDVNADKVNQLSSSGKLRALNRRSFRSILRQAVKMLGVEVTEATIARVIAYRNKLVHEGQFYCRVASEDERASVPACKDETDEYFFLLEFVDKLMLSMLDPTLEPLKFREPEG